MITRNTFALRLAVAMIALVVVGVLMADYSDFWEVTNENKDKNCREYATPCTTEAKGGCTVDNKQYCAEQYCGVLGAGYEITDVRRIGYCATPDSGEKVNGCPTQNPIQCAEYKCYSHVVVTNGITLCIGEICTWHLIQSSSNSYDFCVVK
jgi:hypothetical protein